jgi:hypothetical protein
VSHLFDIEACPDVDEDPVGIGQLALDVEGVCEWHEDGLLSCFAFGEETVWAVDCCRTGVG